MKITLSVPKNDPSLMAMTLAIVSMIAPADAQALSCTSTSPECCWVVESWKKMGKTTSVSATSATDCCSVIDGIYPSSGIPGVYCTSAGSVNRIDWVFQSLKGSIPPELGNLRNLQWL
jgi:hypothetical protein